MGAVKSPVLVVDDHDDTRELVSNMLRDAGFAVVQASNGREALDTLVSDGVEQPCMIVLDLEMPVMSGWEFLAIIKSYYRLSSIPVVIASGSQKTSEAVRFGAAVAYFPKPVDFSALIEKVKEVAHQHCTKRSAG